MTVCREKLIEVALRLEDIRRESGWAETRVNSSISELMEGAEFFARTAQKATWTFLNAL